MSQPEHVIGTYNMSFMSDLSTPLDKVKFASEWTFLSQQQQGEARRSYWINAMNLLNTFIMEKKPSMVGLQEMNLTNLGANTGTDAIQTMLNDINGQNPDVNYKQISREFVVNPNIKPALTIIYNTNVLGDIEGNDELTNPNIQIIDNPIQGGRPILMVITKDKNEKKNVLVTMHGAQDPKLRTDFNAFNIYMSNNNKKVLETTITTFLGDNKDINHIFITGDFNDRYDSIQNFVINEKTVSYKGKAPKSCCYNWDSSCPATDEAGNKMFEVEVPGDKATCFIPESETTGPANKAVLTPPERGAITNYRYRGDKVFGLYPTGDITMFRPDAFKHKDGISKESDHELVYATFSEGIVSGGKRKNNKRSKRSKNKNNSKHTKHTRTNNGHKHRQNKNKSQKRNNNNNKSTKK